MDILKPGRPCGRPPKRGSALRNALEGSGLTGISIVELVTERLGVRRVTAYEYLRGQPLLDAQIHAFCTDVSPEALELIRAKQSVLGVSENLAAERYALAIVRGLALRGKKPLLAGRIEELMRAVFDAEQRVGEPTERVEPAKVEPAKVEPAKVEPAKVEPAKVEPAKVEPVKVEPAKVEPATAKAKPVKAKTTKPVKAKTTKPVKAKTTKPAKAKTTKPAKAKTTKPAKAKTTKPAKAKTTKPAKAKTAKPAKAKTAKR